MKVTQVQQHIETLYKAGCRHTLFLQGSPGIGKSESTKNAATELGAYFMKEEPNSKFGFEQWQATIEDPLELPGLPTVRGDRAVRVPFADKIPQEGRGILCIDEINSASTLTQCSLYSLVWDRKLGGCKLGDDWMIVATGNSDKDRAVTQRIPTPLVSRMEHIEIEPDHDGWIVWMAVRGGHESVRAFVKARPDLFTNFKPDVPGPFACPRTWTMVSDVMMAYNGKTPPIESIQGWVGQGPATEFLTYHMMAMDLPDPEAVLKNPRGIKFNDSPGALYALTTALAGRGNFQNFGAILEFLARIPIEFAVYCVSLSRDVERGRLARMSEEDKKKYKKMKDNNDFRNWCLKHHELIVT